MTDQGLAGLARPLHNESDLDPLLDAIGDARFVLLGEASHGTSQYYRWRAAITRRLIAERGFTFVAVEGDWPDCFAINCWAKSGNGSATDALATFDRWPTWMWANAEVAEFLQWLRDWNRAATRPVGFYGLDVYSLWDSMRAILQYLQEHDPEAVPAARSALRCFEPYGEDPQQYAWATRVVPTSCEDAVVGLLHQLRRATAQDSDDAEARLDAEQNAAVAAGAERYYRAMVAGGGTSWNVRDTHMADTLDRLMDHHGASAKAVVWEHNTHVGDARATDMADAGMVNVGQLVRERHGDNRVYIVGFAGYRGSVIASHEWAGAPQRFDVPPARAGSLEDRLHRQIGADVLLVFPPDGGPAELEQTLAHRAIGVVYDPRRERYGNYVPTVLGRRYDALCYFDETEALTPLATPRGDAAEPETFPSGL